MRTLYVSIKQKSSIFLLLCELLLTCDFFWSIINNRKVVIILKDRIKKLRREMDLTQQEFAEKLGIKRNTIATYESGRNEPIDAVISLICTKFNVNEDWLRNGTGEMFVEQSPDEQIATFIGELLRDEEDSFKRRLISGLSGLDDDGWRILEQFIDSIQKKD